MRTKPKYALARLNSLATNGFVQIVGPVFEHSPWIAQKASSQRPFLSLKEMHTALLRIVRESSEEEKIKLIQAHPDLVGKAALARTLTPESNHEQASAGLGQLSAGEIELFQKNNRAYQGRFGFPFVICARLNKKQAILKGFELRLKNSREMEIGTALDEIGKIAWLRLEDLVDA